VKTDITEKGLESLIVTVMVGSAAAATGGVIHDESVPYDGTGWLLGDAKDYDPEYGVDLAQLRAFLQATQPEAAEALDLDHDSPTRRKFLARLQGETTKRGTIDLLRHGIKHLSLNLDLFYGTPSPGNRAAASRASGP